MFLLWFYFTTRCDWLIKLNQQDVKPKPIAPLLHVFSCAWRRLNVFALNSDWFIALLAPVVIGQSNCFGFGFTTLNENHSINKAKHIATRHTIK